MLEGRVGRIIIKGNKRIPVVRHRAIRAMALVGKPLLKSVLDTALLYARDLPGVTVPPSTLQPGENTGDTDVPGRKGSAETGLSSPGAPNNDGTDLTGH